MHVSTHLIEPEAFIDLLWSNLFIDFGLDCFPWSILIVVLKVELVDNSTVLSIVFSLVLESHDVGLV